MDANESSKRTRYRYLFGPVPSRRLGRSLGIDLVPLKTCTLDCIFCQLGHTVRHTTERKEFVPTEDVLRELDQWVEQDGGADVITLSGSGEPTLHSRFGDVLEHASSVTDLKTALLTNGTLLYVPEVRENARAADIIKITLSAWDEDSFGQIHRPGEGITFAQLVEGERALREAFDGELWVEVFVLGGINSSPDDMRKIADIVRTVGPDRVHLNTVVRPPAESYAKPVSMEHLEQLVPLFEPEAEVIAEFSTHEEMPFKVDEAEILAMLERRPCTLRDIADVFGLHVNEASKYTGKLLRQQRILQEERDGNTFFMVRS